MKKRSIIFLLTIIILFVTFFGIFYTKKSKPILPSFPKKICAITNYGAKAEKEFINTQSFADAISDCAKNGGGIVVVPKGIWLTGPIHLKSNINLHLEKGSIIKFDTNLDKYLPEVFSRFEGMEYYNYSPLIYANDVENIAITGEGEIDGQEKFWTKDSIKRQTSIDEITSMVQNNIPTEKRNFGNEKFFLQPSFIQFINCNKVLIEGIKIKNSPNWTIHPIL